MPKACAGSWCSVVALCFLVGWLALVLFRFDFSNQGPTKQAVHWLGTMSGMSLFFPSGHQLVCEIGTILKPPGRAGMLCCAAVSETRGVDFSAPSIYLVL